MARKQISHEDLEAAFLAALQAEPDCEGVTGVRILEGHRLGTSERWKVVDWKGEGDDEAVESGLKAAYKKLDGTVELTAK